jgi:RNA polymerase sigma-70 factor (ECF subfamily)
MWQRHRPRVWRLVARLAGDPDLADDLTQEVSLRAFRSFGEFRGEASVYTWLYRIAVNVVLRYRERRRETVSLDQPEVAELRADEAASPETTALRSDLRATVWAALERLPDDLRTTLILQVYEGLKYREVARVLNIPVGTVKSRLHTAMQRLREELKEHAL